MAPPPVADPQDGEGDDELDGSGCSPPLLVVELYQQYPKLLLDAANSNKVCHVLQYFIQEDSFNNCNSTNINS